MGRMATSSSCPRIDGVVARWESDGANGEFASGLPAAPAEDAGEIDGDGRIAVLYTFPGPLPAVQVLTAPR